jgi:hypothetical protein
MPKTVVDYSRTIIYKIQHIEKEHLIYVGQTTDFNKRKHAHKRMAQCDNPSCKDSNTRIYKMIRDHGGWDMFKMVQIKEFPCNSRREAEAEEFKVMQELRAVMNRMPSFSGLSVEEHKVKLREWNKLIKDFDEEVRNNYF